MVVLAVAPTSAHSLQRSATACMSSISILRFFRALMTMLKSVTAKGVRAIWKTLVPRLAIFCSTYRLAPCTMVMTTISVATPIVSPSMVSEARSLCARSALKVSARLSRTANMGQGAGIMVAEKKVVGRQEKGARSSVFKIKGWAEDEALMLAPAAVFEHQGRGRDARGTAGETPALQVCDDLRPMTYGPRPHTWDLRPKTWDLVLRVLGAAGGAAGV